MTAALVAVVLAGSVLVWAPLTRAWAVRGVVVWALLVSGAVGLLGWFAHSLATSSLSAAEWLLGCVGWLLLALVLARSQRYVRAALTGRAGLSPSASAAPTPLLRPAVSLAALFAASSVVVAVASGDGGPAQEGRPPQAGLPGSPTASGVPAQPLLSPSASTRTTGPGQPTGAMAGVVGVPWSPVSLVAGVALARSAPSERVGAPAGPSGAAQVPVSAGVEEPGSVVAGPRPGGAAVPTAGSTPTATTPAIRPSGGSSSPGSGPVGKTPGSGSVSEPSSKAPGPGPGHGTQIPGPGPGDGPNDGPGDGPGARPSARPTPLLPTEPVASPTAALTRLLGFEKDKPNRPADAPSPGHGRPDNAGAPDLPAPGPPSPLPPVAPRQDSGEPAPRAAEASRTPGSAKDGAKRPSGVTPRTPGGPPESG
jgi:hypothetical protein